MAPPRTRNYFLRLKDRFKESTNTRLSLKILPRLHSKELFRWATDTRRYTNSRSGR